VHNRGIILAVSAILLICAVLVFLIPTPSDNLENFEATVGSSEPNVATSWWPSFLGSQKTGVPSPAPGVNVSEDVLPTEASAIQGEAMSNAGFGTDVNPLNLPADQLVMSNSYYNPAELEPPANPVSPPDPWTYRPSMVNLNGVDGDRPPRPIPGWDIVEARAREEAEAEKRALGLGP
jgi:hypothetical protein